MSGNKKSPRRRDILRASAGASLLGITGLAASSATAQEETTTETETETQEVDSPEGFSAEVLAPHATFPADVAMEFRINYADGDADGTKTPEGTTTPEGTATPADADEAVTLRDASTVVFAKLTWEPGGRTGWHTHPGPVIVNVTEGELQIVTAEECTSRTYTAGEAFVDPATHDEIATNPSDTEQTVAYATFLGVPDGGPPTEFLEPQDC